MTTEWPLSPRIIARWQKLSEHLVIDEYGAGAYVRYPDGSILADFTSHLDAEAFIDLIESSKSQPQK